MWQAEAGELAGLGAGSGFSVYLSHDDAGRFYQACVESEPVAGECITTFITSRQPTPRRWRAVARERRHGGAKCRFQSYLWNARGPQRLPRLRAASPRQHAALMVSASALPL